MTASESGWFVARAFEKPTETVRFAHTSPVYIRVGRDPGIVDEDANFFLDWMDREIKFFTTVPGFRREADRRAMVEIFREARTVYERLGKHRLSSRLSREMKNSWAGILR
jgi:hypothetical protein